MPVSASPSRQPVGLLLLAHEGLGEALLACAKHVHGSLPSHCVALSLAAHECPSDLVDKARAAVGSVDRGAGVLILTDVFGASPCNLVCKLLVPGKVEAISGMNLPMLLRALAYREHGMNTLLQKAVGGGSEGVFRIEPDAVMGGRVCQSLAGGVVPQVATV